MPHFFRSYEGLKPQRGFKIGIAVPCFLDDDTFLDVCLEAIKNLNPQPYVTVVDRNFGSCLDDVRRGLFDYLFYGEGCDVVLQNSVDFYLFPKILRYVKRNRVVSFAPLSLRRYDVSFAFYHLLFPMMGWSACYSLPIEYWERFKDVFNGYDSSIWKAIGRFHYDFHSRFSYYSLRPYSKLSVEKLLANKSLFKRFVWRMFRLGIG